MTPTDLRGVPERGSLTAALGPEVVTASDPVEKVDAVILVDDIGTDVTITRLCTVEGRTYYRVKTHRAAFEFYVTTKGLIRGMAYA